MALLLEGGHSDPDLFQSGSLLARANALAERTEGH